MNVHSADVLVRRCPQCGSDRPITEVLCENLWEESVCHWSLIDEEVREAGVPDRLSTVSPD